MTLLFWNLHREARADLCANLAYEHSATLLIVAECPRPLAVLNELNKRTEVPNYHLLRNHYETRLAIYSRFAPYNWEELEGNRYFTIRRLNTKQGPDLVFALAHLPILHLPKRDLEKIRDLFITAIHEAEAKLGHTRTIAVGDFNAEPFDPWVFSADGLHAVPTRQLAKKASRRVRGKEYPYFFNPMWSLFGREDLGPPGTFYASKSQLQCPFWHIYDHILIRPALLDRLPVDGVTILAGDSTTSYLNRDGSPNQRIASDHLPIMMKLNSEGDRR